MRPARSFGIARAVLLLALLATACGASVAPAPVGDAAPAASPFVRTLGRRLVVGAENREVRLRGLNSTNNEWEADSSVILSAPYPAEEDYRRVASMGMNTVRCQVSHVIFDPQDPGADSSRNGSAGPAWEWLDRHIAMARRHGLYLIIDLHEPPGGRQMGSNEGAALWTDPRNQKRMADIWRALARRYRDEPTVAAWDLLNEPTPNRDIEQWSALAQDLIDAIRSIDTNHVIIVEEAEGESCPAEFPVVTGENLMYEFHFYQPFEYTTQTYFYEGRAAWGGYPDTEAAIPPPGGLEYVSSFDNDPIPAGASPWRFYEGDLVQVTDERIVAGQAAFSCGPNPGNVLFDDFVVSEFDSERRFVRRVQAVDLVDEGGEGFSTTEESLREFSPSSPQWWTPWSEDGTGEHRLVEGGHRGDHAMAIGRVGRAYTLVSGAAQFPVKTGRYYRISGWMKGDGRNAGTGSMGIQFLGLPAGAARVPFDRAYLESEIQRRIDRVRDRNAPINVGEFGLTEGCFADGRGGVAWVRDTIEIFERNGLHYQYHDYDGRLFWFMWTERDMVGAAAREVADLYRARSETRGGAEGR